MLDYKLVEALASVLEEGGFERAAHRLHITQSAVSQRVRQLEERAGQILLARTSPPEPTEAGRRLLAHSLKVRMLEADLGDMLPPDRTADPALPPSLAVGLNTDSLATWFLDAVDPFLRSENVVLDLRTDDQDRTHELLREGRVAGCVSAMGKPVRGCSVEYLGRMRYRAMASPAFAERFFPNGFTPEAVRNTRALIFNRRDDLHNKLFQAAFGESPGDVPAFYMPSASQFPKFLATGLAWGMLPDQDSVPMLADGSIVNLAPDACVTVDLHWHHWSVASDMLERFGHALLQGARLLLEQPCRTL